MANIIKRHVHVKHQLTDDMFFTNVSKVLEILFCKFECHSTNVKFLLYGLVSYQLIPVSNIHFIKNKLQNKFISIFSWKHSTQIVRESCLCRS